MPAHMPWKGSIPYAVLLPVLHSVHQVSSLSSFRTLLGVRPVVGKGKQLNKDALYYYKFFGIQMNFKKSNFHGYCGIINNPQN